MNPNSTDPPCPAGSSCPPHPPGDCSYGDTPSVPLGAPRGSPVPHSPPGLPPYPASPSAGPGPVSMATAGGCGDRAGPRPREGAGGAPPAGSAPHGGSPGAEGRARPGRRSPGWDPPGREPGRSGSAEAGREPGGWRPRCAGPAGQPPHGRSARFGAVGVAALTRAQPVLPAGPGVKRCGSGGAAERVPGAGVIRELGGGCPVLGIASGCTGSERLCQAPCKAQLDEEAAVGGVV